MIEDEFEQTLGNWLKVQSIWGMISTQMEKISDELLKKLQKVILLTELIMPGGGNTR